MLDEYKELCRRAADVVPEWTDMSKNDLCRAYVKNSDDPVKQNAYLSAILYRYWNLINKYYYLSYNCATPEECYTWLVDSVLCCVNDAKWQDPTSSIFNDPAGPDKVINRCMKCARLSYYQFINRKKRKDDFGLQSIDELKEMFGTNMTEPRDYDQDLDDGNILITDFIVSEFRKKNYFVSFLLYFIISSNVFDIVKTEDNNKTYEFNLRKICKVLSEVTEKELILFSQDTELPQQDVFKAFTYIESIPRANLRKKIINTLEALKHSTLIRSLVEE